MSEPVFEFTDKQHDCKWRLMPYSKKARGWNCLSRVGVLPQGAEALDPNKTHTGTCDAGISPRYRVRRRRIYGVITDQMTSRIPKRREADFYPTPPPAVFSYLEHSDWLDQYANPFAKWLEPCYGDGAIIKAVGEYCAKRWRCVPPNWTAVELRDVPPIERAKCISGRSFLDWFPHDDWFDVCMTNPPYKKDRPKISLAQEFIEHARQMCDVLIMMLPLGFLSSEERSDWWQGWKTEDLSLIVLSDRPSCTGDGKTDRVDDYAWYTWGAPAYVEKIQIAEPWQGFEVAA